MDPVKLALFLLFFFAFLVVTRRLFAREKSPYPVDYVPQPYSDAPDDYRSTKRPAVIGSELPFPVKVPALERLPDGSYNRPKVLNYYFSNLDLKTGPENPRSFCDQLFVEFATPESGARWINEYVVATPFGLQDLLDSTGQTLDFNGTVIIVTRWDMAEILKTVIEDVMGKYAHPYSEENDTEDRSTT